MKKTSKARKAIKITVLSILGVIAAALIIISNILYGRVSTISSVKQLGEGMYTVNYRHDYQLDKALESGIDDERSLLKFICDEMYFGYQVDSNIEKYACSAFLTESPDGDIIAGRNFDYDQTDTLAVYTKPYGGYASISMAVLDFMKVGRPNAVSPMSIEGKLAMLAAPTASPTCSCRLRFGCCSTAQLRLTRLPRFWSSTTFTAPTETPSTCLSPTRAAERLSWSGATMI